MSGPKIDPTSPMIATIKAIKPTMGLIGLFISSATLLLFRGEDTPGLAVFDLIRS
jgi:hypothetical protein